MIYQLSTRLTKWFIQKEMISEEDYDVYVYCIDALLAKLFFYGALLIIATFFDILAITIMYYIGFVPFRYTAGGYHAKTEIRCTALSWGIYAFSMISITTVNYLLNTYYADDITFKINMLSLLLVVFASLAAYLYAPVEHANKPVSAEQKKSLRKYCLCFQIIYIGMILLLISHQYEIAAFSIALGNGIAAIAMLAAYHQSLSSQCG